MEILHTQKDKHKTEDFSERGLYMADTVFEICKKEQQLDFLAWILNVSEQELSYGKDFLMEHEPVALNIKYEHELNYGQTCTSKVELLRSKDELTTLHEIYMADGTLSCSAQVTWR